MHGLHWPEAVLSYVVVALAIGFPVVIALAWAFDVRQGRIERTPAGSLRDGVASEHHDKAIRRVHPERQFRGTGRRVTSADS